MSITKKEYLVTEETFMNKIAKRSAGSKRTVDTILNRFNIWTQLEHDCSPSLFGKMLATDFNETGNPERAYDEIEKYFDFCVSKPKNRIIKGKPHTEKIYHTGGSSKRAKRELLKISPNTIDHDQWYIYKFLRKVGGLKIDREDFVDNITVPMKVVVDPEDAIPIETDMAQLIFEFAPDGNATKPLYRISNDGAFREKETLLTQEKNLHLEEDRPYIQLEQWKSKGGRTKGKRKIFPATVALLKARLTGDPEKYVLLPKKHSDAINEADRETLEGKKIIQDIIISQEVNQTNIFNRIRMKCYKKTGDERWIEKYEHNGFYKINIHSWRKRAGSKFADANNIDMSHGFLRHEKYLPQYMLKTPEERERMIDKAQFLLEFDIGEIKILEIQQKDKQISELEVKDRKIAHLEAKLDRVINKVDEMQVYKALRKGLSEQAKTDHSAQ